MTVLITLIVPKNFKLKESSQSLSGISEKIPPFAAPAEFTKTSILLYSEMQYFDISNAEVGFVKSQGKILTCFLYWSSSSILDCSIFLFCSSCHITQIAFLFVL